MLKILSKNLKFQNKNKIFTAIFLISIFIFVFQINLKASTIDEIKQQINNKEREIQEIEEKINSYKNLILETQKQKNTLKNQINLLDAEITNLNWNIKLTETKIKKINLEIERLNLEIQIQNNNIQNKKRTIGELIKLFQNYDNNFLIEIFLKNLSLSNILNQLQNIEFLQVQLLENIKSLKEYQIKLKNIKSDLEINYLELSKLKQDLLYKKEIKQDQQSIKQNLLRKTKNQENLYQKYLQNLQKQRDIIQREIFELEDQMRYLFDPNSVPKPRPGILTWPLRGVLTQKFGKTSKTGFINHFYKFHNGIDIAAPSGTKIEAAKNGEVIAVGDLGNYAYGKWVAIKHNNGLITLYGHLSKIIIKVGDNVEQNQTIGYVGSTGYSTGLHLHFTVYAANTFRVEKRWFGNLPLGWSLDPLLYL